MPGESASARNDLEQTLAELGQLRQFAGGAAEFWPRFLAALQRLTAADHLTVLVRKPAQPWRRITDCPKEPIPSRVLSTFFAQ